VLCVIGCIFAIILHVEKKYKNICAELPVLLFMCELFVCCCQVTS
jgi:hypothetical protein